MPPLREKRASYIVPPVGNGSSMRVSRTRPRPMEESRQFEHVNRDCRVGES
jgi:hypothetical protein